jgi:hypothetical protein
VRPQTTGRSPRGDERTAEQEPGRLTALRDGVDDAVARGVRLGRQDVGEHRAAGGLERRCEQRAEDEQREDDRRRAAGEREGGEDGGSADVADHHDGAPRVAIGVRREQCSREEPGEVRRGKRRRRGERGAGARVDQQGDGDACDLVAENAQRLAAEQRAELADREDIAVARPVCRGGHAAILPDETGQNRQVARGDDTLAA